MDLHERDGASYRVSKLGLRKKAAPPFALGLNLTGVTGQCRTWG